jgi:hypothetical protein
MKEEVLVEFTFKEMILRNLDFVDYDLKDATTLV